MAENPYRRLPGETMEEQQRRVAALYAGEMAARGETPPPADPLDSLTLAQAPTPKGPNLGNFAGQLTPPAERYFDPLEELAARKAEPPPDMRTLAGQLVDDQGNLFGYDAPQGFSRDDRIRQAGEAYQAYQAEHPYERTGRNWEEDFLARHQADQAELKKRYMWRTFMSGSDVAMRERDMMQSEIQARERGLQQAREMAAKGDPNAPVSRGEAEFIAGTGAMSPEAAAQLRRGDQTVKNLGQFGSLGLRAESQDQRIIRDREKIMAQFGLRDMKDAAEIERLLLNGATQIEVAQIYANRGKPAQTGPGAVAEPTPQEKLRNILLRAFPGKLSPEAAMAAAGGDFSLVPAELRAKVELVRSEGAANVNDPVAYRKTGNAPLNETVAAEPKFENTMALHIAKQRANPKFRTEYKQEWNSIAMPLKTALAAWNAMTPEGKQAFTKLSNRHWATAALQGIWRNPGDAEKAAAIYKVINAQVKATSGSAVTDSEWWRIADEVGIAKGSFEPFKDPAVIGNYLRDAAKVLSANRKIFEDEMGGWDAPAAGR